MRDYRTGRIQVWHWTKVRQSTTFTPSNAGLNPTQEVQNPTFVLGSMKIDT
jgi:hypothetical protein